MTIVVPVRLAAHDRVTQTTSRELTASSLLVASRQRPRPNELMAVRLYLPDAKSPAGMLGKARAPDAEGEFWLDLLDTGGGTTDRIGALLSQHGPVNPARTSPHRTTVRYPTSIPASIEADGKRFAARAIDLSSGGAFVRCSEVVEMGTVVTVKLLMPVPDQDEPVTVGARIVHVNRTGPRHAPWSEPGLGLQFVDGDDEFRRSIDGFLRQAAQRPGRAGHGSAALKLR